MDTAAPTGHRWPTVRPEFAVGLICAAAVASVVSTYPVFDHVYDEPNHLAGGLELLDRGAYSYELKHPPLGRMAVALGPWLAGARFEERSAIHDGRGLYVEGNRVLYEVTAYDNMLLLARLGNQPWLVLLIVATWIWARSLIGAWPALLAVLLVATFPPLLGHAGVATIDVGVTALLVPALLLCLRWLEAPTIARSAAAGAVAGAAIMAKYSALPYLGAALLAWVAWRWALRTPATGPAPGALRARALGAVVALAAALAVCWACFGFRLGPLADAQGRFATAIQRHVAPGSDRYTAIMSLAGRPIYPACVLPVSGGIAEIRNKNRSGHPSFLLGEVRSSGWWYYFAIALLVRTPLPLLLLGLAGLALLGRRSWRERHWQTAAAPLAFAAILIFASAYSHINIGLRYLFILHALLAISAAAALLWLWRGDHWRAPRRALALLLVVWQVGGCAEAYPDHLAYFNLLAGSHPERILRNVDLDWGQDLKRLAAEVRARGIDRIAVAYSGSADPAQHGIPGYRPLRPRTPETGWIAISLWRYARDHADYAWLDDQRPVARIGTSIDLYHVESVPPSSVQQ